MSSKWIKKGDRVIVTAGNSKGQTGAVLGRNKNRITIQGVNLGKKHVKRRTQEEKSAIIEMERSIHISNIAICSKDDRPVKLKVRKSKDGEKELYYKSNGEDVIHRKVKNKA